MFTPFFYALLGSGQWISGRVIQHAPIQNPVLRASFENVKNQNASKFIWLKMSEAMTFDQHIWYQLVANCIPCTSITTEWPNLDRWDVKEVWVFYLCTVYCVSHKEFGKVWFDICTLHKGQIKCQIWSFNNGPIGVRVQFCNAQNYMKLFHLKKIYIILVPLPP